MSTQQPGEVGDGVKSRPMSLKAELKMIESTPTDHRSRVAAERRLKMRRRLVESAMLVFADKGAGASVIQEVVAEADVSQGTFYNYFSTNEDLLAAVVDELSNELMSTIESVVGGIDDPARRIATGIRLYLHTAQTYPVLARFICGVRLQTANSNNLLFSLLPPDIEEGIAKGRFVATPMPVALNLIAGTVIAAVACIAEGADPGFADHIAEAILRGLGAPISEAKDIVARPLAPLSLPPDFLLIRATTRLSERTV